MRASSYTYQTSSKEYISVGTENEQLRSILKDIEAILNNSLYKPESKVCLALEHIKKQQR